jgi:DNA-binding protein Fis
MKRANLRSRLEALVADMVEGGIRLDEAVRELETHFLRRVLQQHNGNQSKAAGALDIHRNTLRAKMRRCGLL